MTQDEPEVREPPEAAVARLAAQTTELARTHRDLRTRRAELGDLSAHVHDEAARVHEELGDRSLLDPQALRAHAQRDREMAAEERAALDDPAAPDAAT